MSKTKATKAKAALPAKKVTGATTAEAAKDSAAKDKDRQSIPQWIVLRLWVKSTGRCEFNGCNKDLYTEELTLKMQKLGEIAHIVAAEKDGPRGDDPLPMEDRNKFDNLMLVCGDHHNLFDKQYVADYPADLLRKYKKDHEKRVEWLLSTGPIAKTKIVRIRTKIGTETVSCTEDDIREAIAPKYPLDNNGIEVDLRPLPEIADAAYWQTCMQTISDHLTALHVPSFSAAPVEHLSVFGFAPIPLLIHAGRCLGNKIPATIYQRHRAPETWKWKVDAGLPANFKLEKMSDGKDQKRAVLIMSLSGKIAQSQIPDELLAECDVYELTLEGQAPNTSFMNTLDDLERFRSSYQQALAEIRLKNPDVAEIHLFPAIPIPVAISCGRELLQKAHPCLVVYDRNKKTDKFQYTLRVNE